MVDNSKEVRKQILDCIGCIAAVVTLITYLVLCINAQWTFISGTSFVYKVLSVIRSYAPLVVVGIVGWEFFADKNIVWRILFYVAVALVVVATFFPNAWNEVVMVVSK